MSCRLVATVLALLVAGGAAYRRVPPSFEEGPHENAAAAAASANAAAAQHEATISVVLDGQDVKLKVTAADDVCVPYSPPPPPLSLQSLPLFPSSPSHHTRHNHHPPLCLSYAVAERFCEEHSITFERCAYFVAADLWDELWCKEGRKDAARALGVVPPRTFRFVHHEHFSDRYSPLLFEFQWWCLLTVTT